MFYSVVRDGDIEDVLKSPVKLTFLPKFGKWVMSGESENFDGVMSSDGTRIWDIANVSMDLKPTFLHEISEEDYLALREALDNLGDGEKIGILYNPDEEEHEKEEITIEFLRKSKIQEMSDSCNDAIVSGVDVVLSSGYTEHFDLTLYDQINLLELQNLVLMQNDGSYVPYHSKGHECLYYSPEDIMTISAAAREFKVYHTTYFNSLKRWIGTLETAEDISKVYYGISIPENSQTVVLRDLIESKT